MSTGQPKPKVPLNNICSAMHNNTLYTYSADSFQSLSLEPGAEWKTLTQAESVTGAACVGSSSGFYVIGGNGGTANYTGLQKYTYSTDTWETITPVVSVTDNRINHGAVYLPAPDSIVVYAGSQDGDTNFSTQTFSIGASPPYAVLAYESAGAPPTMKPIMLAWSDRQAVMVGGRSTNTRVMLFTVGVGWSDSGATLASPLHTGSDPWQASLVTGNDGSKSLYTFDLSVSPNVVNRTVLVRENGAPVVGAVPITKRAEGSKRIADNGPKPRAEGLTQSTWPPYNATYASTATRSNYSAADSDDGQVVLAGGNTEDVLCIFDTETNSWLNATDLLVTDQNTLALSEPATATSPSTTATPAGGGLSATPAAETTAVAGSATPSPGTPTSSSRLGTNGVLGVVLGSVSGAIILLVLLYCQIRKRKRTNDFIRAAHIRKFSDASREPQKEGMAMASATFPRSPINPNFMRGHQPKDSTTSLSSIAILMGKGPKTSMEGGGRRPSFGSNKQLKNRIGNPIPVHTLPSLAPVARDAKSVGLTTNTANNTLAVPRIPAVHQDGIRRSSGWNRYWSDGSAALNILGYGNNGQQQTNRNTLASEGSRYSSNDPFADPHDPRYRITQDSAMVLPLNVDGRPRFNRVHSGSPTISSYPADLKEHMSAEVDDRPPSRGSAFSAYSSGISDSLQDSMYWDPTSTSATPWSGGLLRTTSSTYSNTFPMPPTADEERPPLPRNLNIPSGVSQQPQLSKAHTSDMSWLNLGEQQRRS